MRYFKKFGDFCSGFACFAIVIYLFRKFMTFEPKVEETVEGAEAVELGLLEKLSQFLSRETALDRYLLLLLAVMLCLSVLGSVIFKRIPYVSVIFALPPVLLTFDMIKSRRIEEYPLLILLLTCLAFVSCLYECIRRDRADGGCRIGMAGDALCLFFGGFLLYLRNKINVLSEIESGDAILLDHFDLEIHGGLEGADPKLLFNLAAVYFVLVLVRIILRDIYFIDLILVLPATVAVVYFWNAGAFTFHGELITVFAVAVLCARLSAMLGGRARVKGKR